MCMYKWSEKLRLTRHTEPSLLSLLTKNFDRLVYCRVMHRQEIPVSKGNISPEIDGTKIEGLNDFAVNT